MECPIDKHGCERASCENMTPDCLHAKDRFVLWGRVLKTCETGFADDDWLQARKKAFDEKIVEVAVNLGLEIDKFRDSIFTEIENES